MSVPVEGPAAEEVFVGIPEGAVVDWVDGHGAVVSPTIEIPQLRTRACEDKLFGAECAECVSGCAVGVLDGGIARSAGGAVSEGHVAVFVGCDGAHPAVE